MSTEKISLPDPTRPQGVPFSLDSLSSISTDPLVRSGAPVIPGTRFPVAVLLFNLAEGDLNLREICDEYGQDYEAAKDIMVEIAGLFVV